MTLRKPLYALSLLLFFLFQERVSGQGLPILEFSEASYSFDTIQELGGPVRKDFIAYNKGTAVLRIMGVKASCGCTTSQWPQSPISPGDSGIISIVYDPIMRPGYFYKPVLVESNDPLQNQSYVFIEGYVKARPKTNAELYPVESGVIRFEESHLTFGPRFVGEQLTDTFRMFNAGDYPVSQKKLRGKLQKKYYSLKMHPETLLPGEAGKLSVLYKTAKRNDWGLLFDTLYFATTDVLQPVKSVSVSLNIKMDYGSLSNEAWSVAPEIKLSSNEYRFGSHKAGEPLETQFVIRNSGKTDLEILKISAASPLISWVLSNATIKPGESAILIVKMNTSNLMGPQHKTLTIISNAPATQQKMLSLIGYVN